MKRVLCLALAALMICGAAWGCAPKDGGSGNRPTPEVMDTEGATEAVPDMTGEVPGQTEAAPEPTEAAPEPTAEPTAEPTPEARFEFKPKVCSVYMKEVFGEAMCEAWFSLVDAVMAGEETFACPDNDTYAWIMGQFPRLCFPVLTELIDYPWDRDHAVTDGVGSFTYLVPKEEAARRIEEFAEQIEGILNEVFEDGWSDMEKALALYVYFSRTYVYDWDTYYQDLESPVDYTSVCRLLDTGIGICREVAPAYSYLLLQAGVEAGTMMGGAHEWSYVRIGGRDYHIDATYALSVPDSLAYFMMTDAQREPGLCGRDDFVIVSNYAQDHPHPDYAADDGFFEPVWGYRLEKFFPDEDLMRCWRYTADSDTEYFEFDYSGF